MASARPKKSASSKPAKKTRAATKSPAKKQPAKKSAAKSAAAKKPAKPAARRKAATAADSVDEQLARYRSMRDFKLTAEPSGSPKSIPRAAEPKANAFPFVIQN